MWISPHPAPQPAPHQPVPYSRPIVESTVEKPSVSHALPISLHPSAFPHAIHSVSTGGFHSQVSEVGCQRSGGSPLPLPSPLPSSFFDPVPDPDPDPVSLASDP